MKKILGVGNALTDILLQIESDEVLKELNLPKGSMQLVDKEKQEQIYNYFQNKSRKMIAGGSASNSINGITRLGGQAGFMGKVGRDDVGEFYLKDSIENGVLLHLLESETPSGRCLVLISKDGERTMCTFLGAAAELIPDDLNEELFKDYDIFHIEGYLVQNHNLIRDAVKLAKKAGLLVSLDLASYNIVDENLEFLNEIIRDYVDILFSNEEEARSFTGKGPLDALNEFAELVPIAIVKVGKGGSYIKSDNRIYGIQACESDCIDSTGAGDLYAAGFLYGYARNYPLDICGEIGSLVAGNVIEVVGAKISEERWAQIYQRLEEIIRKIPVSNSVQP